MKLASIASRGASCYRLVLVLCGLALTFTCSGLSASAASTTASTSNAPGASGLSISPLRQTLTLSPGQANKIDITLKNITGGPILAKATVLDFQANNVNGNPQIITNPNYNDPASIKNFLVGIGNVNLSAGQKTTLTIPVQAPSNAAPGAYYGLIEYQAVPQNTSSSGNGNKVALSAGVSTLVFITVPGNVVQAMQINSINVYKDKSGNGGSSIFFTKPPQSVGVNLKNLGNSFETPFGRVSLEDTSGKTIDSYELNSGIIRGLVLPYSNRVFINDIKNIKSPGRYTIVANISYGSGSAILIAKKTFWYIPAWIIIVVILILLALVGLVLWTRYRLKRAPGKRSKR